MYLSWVFIKSGIIEENSGYYPVTKHLKCCLVNPTAAKQVRNKPAPEHCHPEEAVQSNRDSAGGADRGIPLPVALPQSQRPTMLSGYKERALNRSLYWLLFATGAGIPHSGPE